MAPSPGQINNNSLLNNQMRLKENLTEEIDYFIVPEELWTYLVQIYTISRPEVYTF